MFVVCFEDSIEMMKVMNVGMMIEVGLGKILIGFVKKIDKIIEMYCVEDVVILIEMLIVFIGR